MMQKPILGMQKCMFQRSMVTDARSLSRFAGTDLMIVCRSRSTKRLAPREGDDKPDETMKTHTHPVERGKPHIVAYSLEAQVSFFRHPRSSHTRPRSWQFAAK